MNAAQWVMWGFLVLILIGELVVFYMMRRILKETGRSTYSFNRQLLFQVDENPDMVIDPILQAEIAKMREMQPVWEAISRGRWRTARKLHKGIVRDQESAQ